MKYLCYPCALPFQVSQKWGENAEYYSQLNMKGHNGWDFAIPVGTPIYATHDGVVNFAGVDPTLSTTISIDSVDLYTYNGKETQIRSFYAHLSELKVTPGQTVNKGDLIALSGNTGRYTTGPHLHFGIHPIANYQDTEHGNGFGGAIDPIHFFDGTYPTTQKPQENSVVIVQPTQDSPFIVMQKAILAFQLSEGITDFKNKPLTAVLYGNKTLQATNKYR